MKSATRIWSLAITLILVAATLAGCGADWFPAYHRPATAPDPFTFTEQKDVELNKAVTSNAITVAGLTAATSPVTIKGTTTSQYSVNGGTPTSAAGTVKNGDTVTVTHTTAASPGAVTTSTLTIGTVSGSFSTVNQLVTDPTFTITTLGTGITGVASLTAFDSGVAHDVSISDNSGGVARYWITDASGSVFSVSSTNQASRPPNLNGMRLFVQVPTAAVAVVLTIDRVKFDLTFSTTAVGVTRE